MRKVLSVVAVLVTLLASASASAGKCPNMLILLDRSGSMWGQKWDNARQAIRSFTEARQSFMRFGLMVFPAPGDDCGGGSLFTHSDFYTADAINGALDSLKPAGSTPTGDAVFSAGQQTDMADADRPRFIILITDGDPTCPNINDGEGNIALAEQRLNELSARGIKTFVIGFGTDASPAKLDRMAVAGGTARQNATCNDPKNAGATIPCKYYEALDNKSLTAAFDEIARVATGELGGGKTCDDSCYVQNGCPSGQKCVASVTTYSAGKYQLNLGQCVADPCASMTCGKDEFCRDGTCYRGCAQGCDPEKICIDGECVADPCLTPGACICSSACAPHLSCLDGECKDNPCRYITCPESAPFCDRGSCYASATAPSSDDELTAGSGKTPRLFGAGDGPGLNEIGHPAQGCSCNASGVDALVFALAALPGMLLLRRRRS